MSTYQKVALVTGSSHGIGKGIALSLAKNGYDLMIHTATSEEKALDVCKEITEVYGRKAYMVLADLNCAQAPEFIFKEFDKHYDHIDVYINNAGISAGAPFLEMKREMVDMVCDVNLKGAYFCTQQACKRMVDKNIKGNVVIITSNLQEVVMPRLSIYGAVKAGLTQICRHVSMEMACYGIRVNAIAPGFVNSGPRMLPHKEKSMKNIPLHRWAEVEEVAAAVQYLISPEAAFITGSCLTMDGGARNQFYPFNEYCQENK